MIKDGVSIIRNLSILFTLLLFILSGCQSENSKSLNIKELKLEKNDEGLKIYIAENLEDALNAIPFSVKIPEQLPQDINYNKYIISEDKEHIVLYVLGESKDKSKQIAIGVTNNIKEPSNPRYFKETLSLKGNIEAIYLSNGTLQIENKKYVAPQIIWNNDNKEYIVAYRSNINPENSKETLIDIANKMQ